MDDFNKDDFKHTAGFIRYKERQQKELGELSKAFDDAMRYGASYLNVDSNGIKHIPIADIKLNKEREIMTPHDIEVLIHCHVSPAPHPRLGTTGVNSAIQSLLSNGLIERHIPDVYTTTNRGKAHIAQLCSTAWPTEEWVSESGNIIDYMGEK